MLPAFVAFVVGLLVGIILLVGFGSAWVKRAKDDAKRIRAIAEREAEVELNSAKAKTRAALDQAQAEIEIERKRQLADFEQREKDATRKLEEAAQVEADAEARRGLLESQEKELSDAHHEAEKYQRLYKLKLHRLTGISHEFAKKELMAVADQRIASEIANYRMERLSQAEDEIDSQAKAMLLAAMQRIATNPAHETSAINVRLKNDDEKGKIIGKEGRNIRSFETATGATLLIDDTPGMVLVSSFDPVRREVARQALIALLKDGRINPATIEDTVAQIQSDMDARIVEQGETALRRLSLPEMPREVTDLVGRLHYRLSNNQNTLEHSVEVGFIASLIASELGLDPDIAKRAGLFHDMGKCVSHEFEGSHAAIGAEVLRRNGEDMRVVNAVAAHHEEVPAESMYAPLLMVADALSSTRPGARSDSIDGYVRRISALEELASKHQGVKDAYAIQAGREVRIIVSPEEVDDQEARRLARLIRNEIEEEFNFPNPVKITVIRETRFTETAK
ncbi:MAG: ribonuclease Y [Opitutales bacterium]|nr:ribonuclease Y [Opitutales bacterium]NRA26667.1 ribonuclease Y [Opitutales bacterium]